MKISCSEVHQNLSKRLKDENENIKMEQQKLRELKPKVREWADRAKESLDELKASFIADVIDKVFTECEEAIEKQAASVHVCLLLYDWVSYLQFL